MLRNEFKSKYQKERDQGLKVDQKEVLKAADPKIKNIAKTNREKEKVIIERKTAKKQTQR